MRAIPARVLLLAVTIAFTPSLATARCLSYEPAVVTLVGELSSRDVPGPPNYRSLARGDLPETILVLRLEAPICVLGDAASSLNTKTQTGIEEVQLEMPLARARALVGKRVRATGTLSAAQSGHYRTPVVLRVSGLRADPAAGPDEEPG